MPADHPVPAEIAELARELTDQWSEARTQLGELAEVLRDAIRTKPAPSDRLTLLTVGIPAGALPDRIVPYQLDRARVTLVNQGTVTVHLGTGPELTDSTSSRVELAAGASLTLDTRAELWAIVAAGGADAELAIIAEGWDT